MRFSVTSPAQNALFREAQRAECAFPLRHPPRMCFSVECAFPQLGKRGATSWKSTFYVCRLTKRRILEVSSHAKAHSVNGDRNQPNGTAVGILDQNKSAIRATSAMGAARGCRARSGTAGPRWVTDGAVRRKVGALCAVRRKVGALRERFDIDPTDLSLLGG